MVGREGERMNEASELLPFTKPGRFIDSGSPAVLEFARSESDSTASPVKRAVQLFYAVRDKVRYDPYALVMRVPDFCASAVLARGYGFCIPKAIVLASAARAAGIPSRLGLADVRNHLSTPKLLALLGTDVFVHGFTELFLDGRWLKVTPAFNAALCEKFKVKPIEFDGTRDALFHDFDAQGKRHMEYLAYHGEFVDFPLPIFLGLVRARYPHLFAPGSPLLEMISGDFEGEANAISEGHGDG